MRLRFSLLVIDDHPDDMSGAIGILRDHLESVGFQLAVRYAEDLGERSIDRLARNDGKDFDLVLVDYNLGRNDTNGAVAASRVRGRLPYTDIIFYSSDQHNLLNELAKEQVAGVFVADRTTIDNAIVGVAKTIIGKAIDLCHMRGIAMAEVAEMDVLMEDILARAFASLDPALRAKADETLEKLVLSAQASVANLEPIVRERRIVDIVNDGRLFSSAQKFMALRRAAKCLAQKPVAALAVLNDYEKDIIANRNTLAHAKEETAEDGTVRLRSIKKGQDQILIDDRWMQEFRSKLLVHRGALATICVALSIHLDALELADQREQP